MACPGKWKHGLKPAVQFLVVHFDPHHTHMTRSELAVKPIWPRFRFRGAAAAGHRHGRVLRQRRDLRRIEARLTRRKGVRIVGRAEDVAGFFCCWYCFCFLFVCFCCFSCCVSCFLLGHSFFLGGGGESPLKIVGQDSW